MQHRQQRVVIETARHRLVGSLTLPSEGYRTRLLDFLNSADRDFVALTDALVERLDGERTVERQAFVAVARAQIVLALPLEDDEPG